MPFKCTLARLHEEIDLDSLPSFSTLTLTFTAISTAAAVSSLSVMANFPYCLACFPDPAVHDAQPLVRPSGHTVVANEGLFKYVPEKCPLCSTARPNRELCRRWQLDPGFQSHILLILLSALSSRSSIWRFEFRPTVEPGVAGARC